MPNDINDALGEMALSAATVFTEENPDAGEYTEVRTVNGDIFAITEAGFLDTATDAGRIYRPDAIVTPVANVGIVLRATTADMTGGNAANTLSMLASYRVVPAAAFSA